MRRIRHSHPANAVRWATNFRGQRSVIGRRYLFDVLRRATPSVAVDSYGLRLYLSTSDRGVSRETFSSGAYEHQMMSRVMLELKRSGACSGSLLGKSFLDIGANLGSASCLALSHHGASEGWAFEPASENLRLLHQNLLANGLAHRVHVEPVALSDNDGVVEFELSTDSWSDHRVRVAQTAKAPALLNEGERPTIQVGARRFDAFVEDGSIDIGSVGLAWIDVQGHEGHVLAGATKLLASEVPIVCEYWPYGLERAGGLDRFHALVKGSRRRYVDLSLDGAPISSTDQLSDLRDQHAGLSFTDLLLLP